MDQVFARHPTKKNVWGYVCFVHTLRRCFNGLVWACFGMVTVAILSQQLVSFPRQTVSLKTTSWRLCRPPKFSETCPQMSKVIYSQWPPISGTDVDNTFSIMFEVALHPVSLLWFVKPSFICVIIVYFYVHQCPSISIIFDLSVGQNDQLFGSAWFNYVQLVIPSLPKYSQEPTALAWFSTWIWLDPTGYLWTALDFLIWG